MFNETLYPHTQNSPDLHKLFPQLSQLKSLRFEKLFQNMTIRSLHFTSYIQHLCLCCIGYTFSSSLYISYNTAAHAVYITLFIYHIIPYHHTISCHNPHHTAPYHSTPHTYNHVYGDQCKCNILVLLKYLMLATDISLCLAAGNGQMSSHLQVFHTDG